MFFEWLWQNIGSIAVLLALATIVAFIIVCRVKAKRRGESSCGCKCSDCASCSACHSCQTNNLSKPSK